MVPLSGSDVSAQDIEQLLRTLGASPGLCRLYASRNSSSICSGGPTAVDISYHQTLPKVARSCEIALPCVDWNIRTMIAVHLGEEPIFIPDCCWISHDRKTICRRLFSQPFHFSDVSIRQRLAGLSAIKKCYRKT